MRTPSLHIRFDGSFRGSCGGCGAVLWLDNVLLWEGARFLPRCPSSTAAEYEGLLLGLAAAAQHALEPSVRAALTVEGDCRVVLTQFEGRATPRKLSKLHARAQEHVALLAPRSLSTSLVPREQNAHCDALSRAAMDAAVDLRTGSILGTARAGQRQQALALLEGAGRDGVPCDQTLILELLLGARAASDWGGLLSVYAEAEAQSGIGTGRGSSGAGPGGRALAIEALEALEVRRGTSAGRHLVELRRQARDEAQRRPRRYALAEARPQTQTSLRSDGESVERVAAAAAALDTVGVHGRRSRSAAMDTVGEEEIAAAAAAAADEERLRTPIDDGPKDDRKEERALAAACWREALEREVGGPEALRGERSEPEALERLVALAERLQSEHGFGRTPENCPTNDRRYAQFSSSSPQEER
jgi:ribonuclease HI